MPFMQRATVALVRAHACTGTSRTRSFAIDQKEGLRIQRPPMALSLPITSVASASLDKGS
jgi:hypothetical protein